MKRTSNYKYNSLVLSGALSKKRRFRSVIITKSALVTAACVLSAVIFVFTAFTVFRGISFSSGDAVLKSGMADAVPFLSFEKIDKKKEYLKMLEFISGIDFTNPVMLVAYASPMLSSDFQNDKEIAEEKIDAIQKESDITETNSPSVDLKINNESKYEIDKKTLLDEKLNFNISSYEPTVLIVHTHGSESYTASKAYNYPQSENYRTNDTNYNMIRIGEEIAKNLKSEGIGVIHDKTINDYPSYNDSYNKTEKVISKNLKEHPSIQFVFDIHRDAAGDGENKIKLVSNVNGEKAAQVMIVCGTDQNLENPAWRKNLSLALKIQDYFEKEYPSFMRPINLRKERFNMHLTTGSLLFEVGTNSNTLDEALSSARCLGKGIAEVIKTLE